ncbi:MAG: DUF2442 domain-containing protein [Chitinivibrionales bacterium]|nr:DUF2442 domain-containing protein [Chitinivibrionales bacterium]
MEKIPRILRVKPLEGKHLEIQFDNGINKDYDCNAILNRPEFFLLKNDAFFKSVKADAGGYGISWNDDIDISEFEVWVHGTEIKK